MPSSACVKLMSYYQSHNLGIPRYQYINSGNMMTTAQIMLPDNSYFVGIPGRSKEEASESAAQKALKHLLKCGQSPSKNAKSPRTFPTPPRQWYSKQAANESVVQNPVAEQRQSQQKDANLFVPLQAVRNSAQLSRAAQRRNIVRKSEQNGLEKADPSKEEGTVSVVRRFCGERPNGFAGEGGQAAVAGKKEGAEAAVGRKLRESQRGSEFLNYFRQFRM